MDFLFCCLACLRPVSPEAGTKSRWNTTVYVSLIDNNVWAPDVYGRSVI